MQGAFLCRVVGIFELSGGMQRFFQSTAAADHATLPACADQRSPLKNVFQRGAVLHRQP